MFVVNCVAGSCSSAVCARLCQEDVGVTVDKVVPLVVLYMEWDDRVDAVSSLFELLKQGLYSQEEGKECGCLEFGLHRVCSVCDSLGRAGQGRFQVMSG